MGCSTSAVPKDGPGATRNSDREAEARTADSKNSGVSPNSKATDPVLHSKKVSEEDSAVEDVSCHPIGQEGNHKADSRSTDQPNATSDEKGCGHVSSNHGTISSSPSPQGTATTSEQRECDSVQVESTEKQKPHLSSVPQAPTNTSGTPGDESGESGVEGFQNDKVGEDARPTSPDIKEHQNPVNSQKENKGGKLNETEHEKASQGQVEVRSHLTDQDSNSKSQGALQNKDSGHQPISEEGITGDVKQSDLPVEPEAGQKFEEHQTRFSQGVRSFCRLVNPEELLRLANPHVRNLTLERVPAGLGFPFRQLLMNLTGITELNLSGNQLGPQAFRVIALAMCHNKTVTSLDISDNKADTDSSECLGRMLTLNSVLVSLNVSSNQLGRDFFSRCVGPPLGSNTSLKMLSVSSCGLSDLDILLYNLSSNSSLKELDVSHNQMKDGEKFAAGLRDVLKSPACRLKVLHIRNCGIGSEGMRLLTEAVLGNVTLEKLYAGGNMMTSPSEVTSLLLACFRHPAMTVCNVNDTGVTSQEPASLGTEDLSEISAKSAMTSLSIANCSLSDDIIAALANQLPGSLPNLSELDLTGNTAITVASFGAVSTLTTANGQPSNLRHLCLGSLNVIGLPRILQEASDSWSGLHRLDLRRAKVNPSEVGGLGVCCLKPSGLTELCLEGLKLSGSDALEQLLGSGSSCSIESLSLASCALQDSDLSTITAAVSEGWAIRSLKLSANRLTDTGAVSLMESFLARSECTLVDLNLANNRLSDSCAETVSKLVSSAPNLHSLLLGHNAFGGASLKTILASLRPMESSLRVLDLCSQDSQVDEGDVEELMNMVAEKLGYKIEEEDGTIKCGTSPLHSHPRGLTINLMGLGGSGETGQALDSLVVKTDYAHMQLPWLSLQHSLELSDWLKGSLRSGGDDELNTWCSLTGDEWCRVLGLPKDPSIPSWLQVSKHRRLAVYLTGLPGGVSAGKLEGDLESDADCLVEEVCIMKDFILRKPNGIAWVLLGDEPSVQKAMEYFYKGKALMFSQPYMISHIKLSVTESEASSEDETKARLDLEARAQEAAREEAEHRALLASSYQASQERHEYAKANPAYADGRIW